ncbi:hypothetical protein ABZ329_29230 [Streptomyces rubiginosohelvolus]|uniref:hypothetical protein n=1 Tax=Streptomyces rubiginosohelvolus TaxID=67362 RepID=UPI0033E8BFD1
MSTLHELRAAGCRTWKLTHQNIGIIDDAVDKDGIYAKGYWENVDGKTTVTGLRIGTGESRIVAKFGTWIVRHPNGQWAIHTPECARCDDSGIDPEDSHPGFGPNDYSMGEPPALEPCRNCGPGSFTASVSASLSGLFERLDPPDTTPGYNIALAAAEAHGHAAARYQETNQ